MKNFVRHSLVLGAVAAIASAGSAAAAGLKWVPVTGVLAKPAPGSPANAAGPAVAVKGQPGPTKGAAIPGAIIGGKEPNRVLPICRGMYNNGIHPGKVVAGKCNIGWGGKEVPLASYEVLTGPAKAVQWVKTAAGKMPPGAFIGGKETVVGAAHAIRLLPICRAPYQNGIHPGKVVAGKCNIGWGGKEIVLPVFETMVVAPAGLAQTGIRPALGGLKGDPRAAELAALIAALQAEKQDPKFDPLKHQAMTLKKQNERLKLASEALKALLSGQPVTGKTASGMEVRKAAEAAGIRLSGGKGDADRKALEALIAKLQQDSRADMAKVQNALKAVMDKRNQQYDLLVSLIQKMAEAQQAMVHKVQ